MLSHADALAMAAKQKFDVIITDHRTPRSHGLELVRKLEQRRCTGKIVVLSAYLSPEHIGTTRSWQSMKPWASRPIPPSYARSSPA
jgi:CheY-like chemotaxis protein